MVEFKVERGQAAPNKGTEDAAADRGDAGQTVNAWETEQQIDTVEIAADANAMQGAGATMASLSGLLRPGQTRADTLSESDASGLDGFGGSGEAPPAQDPQLPEASGGAPSVSGRDGTPSLDPSAQARQTDRAVVEPQPTVVPTAGPGAAGPDRTVVSPDADPAPDGGMTLPQDATGPVEPATAASAVAGVSTDVDPEVPSDDSAPSLALIDVPDEEQATQDVAAADAPSVDDATGDTDDGPVTDPQIETRPVDTPVDDPLTGGTGDDSLIGGAADETLTGLAGDDRLDGGAGNDLLDGGAGRDTAVYTGTFADYAISSDGADVIVSDLRPDAPDGTDRLRGIEDLVFADRTLTMEEALNVAPELSVAGGTVTEGLAMAQAATVSARDANPGDTVEVTVDDPRFEIVDGVLRLRPGEALDYEEDGASVEVTVTATDRFGARVQDVVSVKVSDVAETIQLAPGGASFTDTGVTETAVLGGTGDDLITGGAGADRLFGGTGADTLVGEDGNDDLTGGQGDDRIEGGTGNDTARWDGDLSNFSISLTDGTFTLTDLIGNEGSDRVTGVERFEFNGTTYSLAEMRIVAARQSDTPPTEPYMTGAGAVSEDAPAGTVIGRFLGGDIDGDAVTYVLTDAQGTPIDSPRYEIVGDELRLRDGGSLDFEDAAAQSVFVMARTELRDSAPVEMRIEVADVAETVQLDDGGQVFTDAGVAETAILGGDGADHIVGNDGGATLSGKAGDDTLTGGAGRDRLDGGAGDDMLSGGDNDDSLTGGDGDDRLHGGEGFNTLDGGAGHDTAVWDRPLAELEIAYDEATDTFEVIDPIDLTYSDRVTGIEIFDFAGVTYTAADLRAHAGGAPPASPQDPRIADGGSVAENSAGGVVVATLDATGSGGPMTFALTDAAGTPQDDPRFEIVGNEIRVRPGADIDFETDPAHDLFVTVSDSNGTSDPEPVTITIEDLPETPPPGSGETFTGTDSADTLQGGFGDDSLFGGAGDDQLFGGAGDDRLHGGTGFDELIGGDGHDTYVVGAGEDLTMITDGGAAWTDTLVLDGITGNATVSGDTATGEGWTMVLDSGSTFDANGPGVLDLSDDSSGLLTFDDGSTVDFVGLDRVAW